jgi:Glycosyl transferase family 90
MICYNSLAIKVEPEYADHFFFDLVPWKHYVPVKSDLSDLIDNIQFVLDPANDGIIRNMIGAANQWCMQRLTKQGLVLDQLDVWNAYVERLDGPLTVPGPENTEFADRMVRLPIS